MSIQLSAEQIANILGGKVEGDPSVLVNMIAKIETATEGQLTFFSNTKYEPYLYQTNASVVLVNNDFVLKKAVKPTLIRVEDAYLAFTQLLTEYQKLISPVRRGIEQPVFIGEGSDLPDDVYLGSHAYVGQNCKIGKGVKIYPHVWIDNNCTIGEGTTIFSGSRIYTGTEIGNNCVVHANVVIGSDGFGFAPKADGSYQTIPQLGTVLIEDEVSIGAGTTIDRATLGKTIIRTGVKIDNLVQIAHNVEIGKHTVIAAQAAIAGSSSVGEYCMIGGQVGIVGHIKIADRTHIGAKAGVNKNVTKPGLQLLGSPAQEFKNEAKSMALYKKLPQLEKIIQELRRQIAGAE